MIYANYLAGDNTRAQQPDGFEPNSSGMVLVVVIIFAALAAILAASLYFASGARIKQVRREICFEKAFFMAEAGIERAKAELHAYTNNLNYALIGKYGVTNPGVLSFGCPTNYGDGSFYVYVRNNLTNDPNPTVDTDHIVIIRSTGIVETATRVIETEVQFVPFVPPIKGDGALGVYGSNASLSLGGNAAIDGNDWNLPPDFTKTQGSHGNGTLTTNTAKPGFLYESTSTVVSVSGSSSINGNPPITNTVGMYDQTYWYQFLNTIMAAATIYTGGSLGTRSAPIITLFPTGTTQISANVSGAGILIIPGGASVQISGTLYYEGMVIVEGNGTISKTAQSGTVYIFGNMICLGGALSMSALGNFELLYSTQAFDDVARLSVPAQMNTIYWKEIKASSTNW